jgi:hypothetical protein
MRTTRHRLTDGYSDSLRPDRPTLAHQVASPWSVSTREREGACVLRIDRDRARASGDRARRRARALARSNRSLRSGLRRTRRALARARP